MNKKILLTLLPCILLISGCSSSNHDDLEKWMKDQFVLQKGRISPLPEAKRFEPIEFVATVDPFTDRPMLSPQKQAENKYAPDPYRRKEPLEQYSLSQLMMVGIFTQNNAPHALIKSPDNIINYVTIGNYMGSNYGKIIEIKENGLTLEERVMGGSDGWSVINTNVPLVEEKDQKSRGR